VFTPSPQDDRPGPADHRRDAAGAAEGKGAVSLDGKLIDAASIKMAENMVRKADQMPVDVASA
jgi:malyl-CoA/(S)-citramalyl-CoA lyase